MILNNWRIASVSLGALVAFASVSPVVMADEAPAGAVVYKWGPGNFHEGGGPYFSTPVTLADGTQTLSIEAKGLGFNNYIVTSPGRLKSGHEYTAILKYEVVKPTKFPDSFYMFARSRKLGLGADFWQYYNGDPGEKGTARLSIPLVAQKASDDWVFYAGCKGPGTVTIDSLEIVEGNGLDFIPATAGAKPANVAYTPPGKLPTGAVPFAITPPAKTGLTLSAKDFGLVADAGAPVSAEQAAANFTAISTALKATQEKKADTLVIPAGTYRIGGRAAIPVVDINDLTIDGQGSTFIFENMRSGVEAFWVQKCSRVVLKNFKVDWDWDVAPIASLGKVEKISDDGMTCDFSFPDLTEAQIEKVQKARWQSIGPMDPVTLTRVNLNRRSADVASVTAVDPKTLRATFKAPVTLQVGESYCIRHLYYDFGCFKTGSCNNLVFDNVTIYSMPGMGFFNTGDMQNFAYLNCKIVRPEGSRRPLTTAADGLHVSQSKGNLLIQNCEFTGTGDDMINIHDNVFEGVQRVDDHTLTLVDCSPWRIRVNAGDRIELFKAGFAPLGFSTTLKTVEFKKETNNTTVTTEDALPADLSPLTIVVNRRFNTSNVRIANCNFHDSNGRSILLSTNGGTIENCTFKNAYGTAIQLHTEIVQNLWAEGSGVSNLVIRGNTFEDSAREGRYNGATVYSGAKLPTGTTTYPLYHDMLIEKNRFIDSSGPAISLNSAGNVVVRDNVIEAPRTSPIANSMANSLFTSYSSDIAFTGNSWTKAPEVGKAGVFVDSATTSKVTAEGNLLGK